jgi:predicted aspartyl protease
VDLRRLLNNGVSHFIAARIKWLTPLLLAACAAAPVSLEIVPAPQPLERRYLGFWDAALALDYEHAALLAATPQHRDYARAMRELAEGRLAPAQELLSALTANPEAAPRARALLAAVAKESDEIPAKAFESRVDRSFAEALLEARRAERWSFPPQPVPVPFERGGSPTPLVPASVNGLSLVMGIDTGAGLTVIGSDVAHAAGAKRLGARTGARDAHGEGVQVELALVDLDVGGIRIERHPVIVIDSARLRFRVAGVQVSGFDGMLGWNALSRLRTTIDNDARTVRFEKSAGTGGAPGNLFWIGEPYVRARASNGFPLTLFVDTGASRTALARPVAARAGLTAGEAKSTLVMAAGSSRKMEVVVHRDAALHVGGARVVFGELQALEPRATGYTVRDGVLGADAFARGRIVLDPEARELTIRP